MSIYTVPPQLPELKPQIRAHFLSMTRRPDIDSANLHATDQADVLGARLLTELRREGTFNLETLLVLNDSYGALASAAALLKTGQIYSFQDRLSQQRAALQNLTSTHHTNKFTQLSMQQLRCPDAQLQRELAGVELVLLKLPRAQEELGWLAWAAARLCPDATLVAVGLQKYMTVSQNEVLRRYFGHVSASRGFGKARALVAAQPIADAPEPWQHKSHDVAALPGGALELSGGAATFGAERLDPSSRLLIKAMAEEFQPTSDGHIVDLGCGNGTLAVSFALLHPTLSVTAVDQSASAVISTLRSAELSDVSQQVSAARMDALEEFADGSVAHVVLNPPFHSGHAVDTQIATKLFRAAARALCPGGTLWCVWNSGLKYRPELETLIGPTRQVARNAKFTVTVSQRR
ncbi:class I SAM-dependent methyltransferase [Micrococcoides hystricis]|uniref:Class I SAM-dependent methyltransferase n=1 Tax=Micrococcoides hystricis TaxID=1572761 RepID=A0ABV6P719_9MICC